MSCRIFILMNEVLKIHIYRFSPEREIGSNMQLTQNCGYDSDDRKFSTSKGAVVRVFSWLRCCCWCLQCLPALCTCELHLRLCILIILKILYMDADKFKELDSLIWFIFNFDRSSDAFNKSSDNP